MRSEAAMTFPDVWGGPLQLGVARGDYNGMPAVSTTVLRDGWIVATPPTRMAMR
jgi:hypothetical protein